jgi:hypothetical protein
MEESSAGSEPPSILSQEQFTDEAKRDGFLSHFDLPYCYNKQYASDFDCETVSSISRLSAITDVILLSNPEHGGAGGILSLQPPQPDYESSAEQPWQSRISRKSVPMKVDKKSAPSEGVFDLSTLENQDARTNDTTDSGKILPSRWKPLRSIILLIFFVSFAGVLLTYLARDVDRDNDVESSTTPNEQSPNVVSTKDNRSDNTTILTSPPVQDGLLQQSPTPNPDSLLVPKSPVNESSTAIPTTAPSIHFTQTPTMVHTSSPASREDTILSTLSTMNTFDSLSIALNNSPQNLAYKFLLDTTRFDLHGPERIIQRYSMAVFYFSTLGDSWERNDGWLNDENECNWYNQDTYPCNVNGTLLRLKLERNNLLGEIPNEISLLQNIVEIEIGGNDLVGQIPTHLGRLQKLKVLDLSWTQIDGEIPSSLGNASSLEYISLVGTSLSGTIPTAIGGLTHLKAFQFARNKHLSGSLPTAVCSLPDLHELWADCDLVSCPCCNYCCYRLTAIETCQYV